MQHKRITLEELIGTIKILSYFCAKDETHIPDLMPLIKDGISLLGSYTEEMSELGAGITGRLGMIKEDSLYALRIYAALDYDLMKK